MIAIDINEALWDVSEQPTEPTTEKGRRTRRTLVEAATVVFAQRGLFDTRVTDITSAAGLSPAAFYRYFESKSDILGEAVDSARDSVMQALSPATPAERELAPFDRFARANRRYLEAYRANAHVVRMLEQRVAIDATFRIARRDWQPAFVGRIEAGLRRMQDSGVIDVALDLSIIAPALSAMVENLAYVYFVLGEIEELPDAIVDVIDVVWGNVLGLETEADARARFPGVASPTSPTPTEVLSQTAALTWTAPDRRQEQWSSAKGASTRAEILRAARSVFEANGYLDTRVGDISAAAGVAHGTFYNYFDSRFEVFSTLAFGVCDDLFERLDAIRTTAYDTVAARVAREITLAVDYYAQNVPWFAVLEQFASVDRGCAKVRLEIRGRFADRVRRGIARMQSGGHLAPTVQAAAMAEALVSMFDRSMFEWHVLGVAGDIELAADHLSEVWVRALGVDPTATV